MIDEESEKRIRFLRETIPPDDIYIFADSLMMSCSYLMELMDEYEILEDEIERDDTLRKITKNVACFFLAFHKGSKSYKLRVSMEHDENRI